MNQARAAFEAFMSTKSKDVANYWDGKKYTNANIQTKWTYFRLGWTMKEQIK